MILTLLNVVFLIINFYLNIIAVRNNDAFLGGISIIGFGFSLSSIVVGLLH